MLWCPCQFDPRVKPERGSYVFNPDHLLGRGLVALWMLDEAAGAIAVDTVTGIPAPFVNPRWRSAGVAPGAQFSGNGRIEIGNRPDLLLTTQQTVHLRATIAGTGARTLASKDNFQAGQRSWSLHVSGSSMTAAAFNSGTVTSISASGWAASNGAHRSYIARYRYITDGGSLLDLMVNGVSRGRSTSAIGPIATSSAAVRIGARDVSGSPNYLDGLVEVASIYRRCLTVDEAAWLSAEPYAMLQPAVDKVYSVSGVNPYWTNEVAA